MKNQSLLWILLIGLELLFSSSSLARVAPVSLEALIRESDHIVLGRVERIEKTQGKDPITKASEYRATIAVERSLKGKAISEIVIHYFPLVSTQPEIVPAQLSLFFIRQHNGKFVIHSGPRGKFTVINGTVNTRVVGGIENETIESLAQKIKSLISRDSTRPCKH